MTRPLSDSSGSDQAIPRRDPHGGSHHAIMQDSPSPPHPPPLRFSPSKGPVKTRDNQREKERKKNSSRTPRLAPYCVIVGRLLAKGLSLRGCVQETSLAQFSPLRVFQPSQSPNPFWSSTPNVNTLARGRSGDLPRATRDSPLRLPERGTPLPCSRREVNGGFSANAEGFPCLRRLGIRALFEVLARLVLLSPPHQRGKARRERVSPPRHPSIRSTLG